MKLDRTELESFGNSLRGVTEIFYEGSFPQVVNNISLEKLFTKLPRDLSINVFTSETEKSLENVFGSRKKAVRIIITDGIIHGVNSSDFLDTLQIEDATYTFFQLDDRRGELTYYIQTRSRASIVHNALTISNNTLGLKIHSQHERFGPGHKQKS